jgi:hypothetical protein
MVKFSRLMTHTLTHVWESLKKLFWRQRFRWLAFNRFPVRLIILGLSVLIGVLFSQSIASGAPRAMATLHSPNPENITTPKNITTLLNSKNEGTVDEVPQRFEFGQQLYLETCATCHVGIPPAVLPTQTWANLLDDPQHYSVWLSPVVDPTRLIIWQYLEYFSRVQREDEPTPYRIRNSRYFGVLHPKVDFDEPVRLNSCVSCHPGAPDFNYRQLTPEWDDAP